MVNRSKALKIKYKEENYEADFALSEALQRTLYFECVLCIRFCLVELGIPTIISDMIDNGVMYGNTDYLLKMGLLITVISIIGVGGTILLGYCCAKISTSVTRDIRNDVFEKVQSFSHHEINQFGVASLITRTNNDAFQIMNFLSIILRTALLTPVMIIVSFSPTIAASLKPSPYYCIDCSRHYYRCINCRKSFRTNQ